MDSKLEQLGSKLNSKLDAYAASLNAKISGIYQFLSKEKLSNLGENGSSNKTPLLPTPSNLPRVNPEPKSVHSLSEKWGKPFLPIIQESIKKYSQGKTPETGCVNATNSSICIKLRSL